jgi:hypothetical protein
MLISCSEIENKKDKESCDFEICDAGRDNIDTLTNEYGVLKKKNNQYYIEVTSSDTKPETHYISCLENDLILPETGNYVKFSGYIKDPCSEEKSSLTDSLFLQEIEIINPQEKETCEQKILQEGFDISKNDAKLKIHHLKIINDCLHVLISYTGGCNQIPELSLHDSGEVLFGSIQLVVSLQGMINDDCDQENYVLMKYDLDPIWSNISDPSIQEVILYFQSQGLLRIGYSQ